MAMSGGFAVVLLLTLLALLTCSHPLFHSTPVPGWGETPQPAIARGPPQHSLHTSEISDHVGSSCNGPNWVVGILRRRQRTSIRKLIIHHDPSLLSSRRDNSREKKKSVVGPRPRPRDGGWDSPGIDKPGNGISRRSILATFQSDRMVPSGSNPLHNNNRSQVIFP